MRWRYVQPGVNERAMVAESGFHFEISVSRPGSSSVHRRAERRIKTSFFMQLILSYVGEYGISGQVDFKIFW
jgi:hypothetical protein